MIIISQNEYEIYNSDKFEMIDITVGTSPISYNINIEFNSSRKCMGIYESPERAKEVFDDIVKALYAECRIYNMPKS